MITPSTLSMPFCHTASLIAVLIHRGFTILEMTVLKLTCTILKLQCTPKMDQFTSPDQASKHCNEQYLTHLLHSFVKYCFYHSQIYKIHIFMPLCILYLSYCTARGSIVSYYDISRVRIVPYFKYCTVSTCQINTVKLLHKGHLGNRRKKLL